MAEIDLILQHVPLTMPPLRVCRSNLFARVARTPGRLSVGAAAAAGVTADAVRAGRGGVVPEE
jgi:hypothetical protein